MKRKLAFIGLVVALAAALVAGASVQASDAGSGRVRVIVGFDPAVNEPAREALMARFGGVEPKPLPIIDGAVVLLPVPALSALAGEPGVRFAEADQRVFAFDKPPWAGQPGGPGDDEEEPPPQVVPTGIDRIDAEPTEGGNTGSGVKVAVIDTGIDYTHPDLDLNYAGGYDYVNDDDDPMDDNGHGTHVAGIIGAEDNDIGVVGVAPGVSLYAVKVLDNRGSGWISDIIAGIDWAVENEMDVANLSLGGKGTSDALETAVQNAASEGVTLVVSAGNESDDAAYYVPAAYDEVITVSAIADFDGLPGGLGGSKRYGRGRFKTVQADDAFAYFSNYGQAVDLAAPGVDIYSTYAGGGYETMDGTSMAAPHVAGAAALYIAAHPGAVPSAVEQGLQNAGFDDDLLL